MEYLKDIENQINLNSSFFKQKLNNFSEDEIKSIIKTIIQKLSMNPLVEQKEIFNNLKLKKIEELKIFNQFIRENYVIQEIITKKSVSKKYWNTILPFANISEKVLNNEYRYPMRIAIFPGVSCMFYCGFCGRNQNAKYANNVVDDGVKKIQKILETADKNSKISISGGLEPLTNPKIGEIIQSGFKNGFKIPLITNGYSLTEGFIKKNPNIWKLDSIRISLYGYDQDSYKGITRVNKSYEMVKKNLTNFINHRNEINQNLKIGLNYIILPENMENLITVLKFIEEINSNIKGPGINFLTLRDDYQSVTGNDPSLDDIRKYRLQNEMTINQRKKLLEILQNFKFYKKNNLPNLHVDYGYSLEYLSNNIFDEGLAKVKGNKLREFGFTQMSVAVDLHGDVFLFREAGFLERPGNKKVIIGRVSEKETLESIIKNFLKKNKPIQFENEDSRFLDSFDHVLNLLVNQSEQNMNFGIPLSDCPISFKKFSKEKSLGNNWYSDDI
jgi:dTDP-4-amino-4,6-dideoxy-D-glucose ammonia-lyase